MEIKSLQESQLKEALDLVWSVFEEFEVPEYPPEGARKFQDSIAYPVILERVRSGRMSFWACFVDQAMAGVIATRGMGHISMLFVKKEYHRQGIAKALFNTALEDFKKQGVQVVTVNSSPYVVEVYHRLGFTDTNSEQLADGIRFTPMQYLP
jgi:GNAT superfamily N-acetyltransferase